MSEIAKVCILATGGTIASVTDTATQVLRPGLSVEELIKTLPSGMSNIEVVERDLFQLDSANMQPHHWQEIATAIKNVSEEISDLQGIVVTHGTDTMVYSASATSLMIQDFGKPIVFTGSQVPASVPWSDGPRNLLDAIRVAAFGDLGETCIVFNGEIHRPTRTKKVRVKSFNAFDSMDPRPLGVLARDIDLFDGRRKRHNLVPKYDTRLDEWVFLLKVFPGCPPGVLSKIVDLGYHGIIIEGYGEGAIPIEENALTGGIQQAVTKGCFVVISSQCAFGQANPTPIYEVSRAAMEVGAMSAYDTTSEAALVKLAWVLGHTREPEQVKTMMMKDYVGESSFNIDRNA